MITTTGRHRPEPARDTTFRLHSPGPVPARHRLALLHGMANSSTVWTPSLRHLPAGFEAWAADLPWRGDGDPVWSHEGSAAERMLDAIRQVPRPVDVVVAHSFSACVLMGLLGGETAGGADLVAECGIKALVLVSPFHRRRPKEFSWREMAGFGSSFTSVIEDGIRLHSGGRLDEELLADVAGRVCDRIGPYGWLRFFEAYLGSPWVRPDLVRVPCLLVSGAQDKAWKDADILTEDLPDATLHRIPECGHFPMLEHPVRFAAVVSRFVQDVHNGQRGELPCPA